MKIKLARRRFLAGAGLGLLTSVGWPRWLKAMEGMESMARISPLTATPGFKPDVELDLTCRPSLQSILPGAKTRVYRYHARLRKGPENTLLHLPDSYLGPVLRFETGQKIRIHLHNQLMEPSITHWHGLHVPTEMDGHPRYAIGQGETFVYEFEMRNRAGMAIYHPHPHDVTGWQVYQGLAGAILINDAEETRLQLPDGDHEIPLVIQDRLFSDDNQLIYARHMHDRMMGMHGDRILVNGRPDFELKVDSRAYRFRVLNASNARIYKLAWNDGSPITVLGTDGGLLPAPVIKPYVMLAPGERLDVWADFSGRAVGEKLELRSRPFHGALPMMAERMMQRGMHGSSLPLGGDYPLMTVTVARAVSDSPELPRTLADADRFNLPAVANADNPVPIGIGEGPMRMVLNGRPYAENDLQPRERIPVDTVQAMEILHEHGMSHGGGMGMGHGMGGRRGGMGMGGMMTMAHPIHLHGQPFQIAGRYPDAVNPGYDSVKDGFIDNGFKDTVLVMPGERVRIVKPFQDYRGLFMMHCHNLEHEDMGMMRDLLVV